MSGAPSPVPPSSSGGGGGGDDDQASATGDSWRVSVPQSSRNAEVREIARVLAALEPGATSSSKLRLAMQFEDAVFKQATSLGDYRKRLAKRLKKVQKTYVPPSETAVTEASRLTAVRELRSRYGETLLYILKHAETAVQVRKAKNGPEEANRLRQHCTSALTWARDLGLAPEKPDTVVSRTLSDSDVQRLKELLDNYAENVRSHVIKLADPDGFLGETLARTERMMMGSANANSSASDGRAARLLAESCRKRYEQLSSRSSGAAAASAPPTPVDPRAMIEQALQTIDRPVPLPTRITSPNSSYDKRLALLHLEKMLASSSLLLGWTMALDKNELPSRTLLSKAHATALEGVEVVTRVVAELRRAEGGGGGERTKVVTLEDAWMKPLLVPPPPSSSFESVQSTAPTSSTHLPPVVVRTRVLLTPSRKPSTNLLNALRRKRARLVRPPPRGEGSHVVLDVGKAFTMTIYFVPLLVTLRAQDHQESQAVGEAMDDCGDDGDDDEEFDEGCASMKPLGFGLGNIGSSQGATASGNREGQDATSDLRVWGVRGPVEILGRVVEERLRDAGTQATATLRACFASSCKGTGSVSVSDFETELLEASALLEFLQLARTTYEPDWQDDDV
jgi:hypothetical protein